MQYTEARLASFDPSLSSQKVRKYWAYKDLDPKYLARCGFYFTPTKKYPDQITCFSCHKRETNVGDVEDITKHHLYNSSHCPYSLLMNHKLDFLVSEDSKNYWSKQEDLFSEPLSPKSLALRKSTFEAWKFDKKRTKTKCDSNGMASAGFFYNAETIDHDDRVECAYCDVSLDGWDIDDDPLEEHKNNCKSTCYFLEKTLNWSAPKNGSIRNLSLEMFDTSERKFLSDVENDIGTYPLDEPRYSEEEEDSGDSAVYVPSSGSDDESVPETQIPETQIETQTQTQSQDEESLEDSEEDYSDDGNRRLSTLILRKVKEKLEIQRLFEPSLDEFEDNDNDNDNDDNDHIGYKRKSLDSRDVVKRPRVLEKVSPKKAPEPLPESPPKSVTPKKEVKPKRGVKPKKEAKPKIEAKPEKEAKPKIEAKPEKEAKPKIEAKPEKEASKRVVSKREIKPKKEVAKRAIAPEVPTRRTRSKIKLPDLKIGSSPEVSFKNSGKNSYSISKNEPEEIEEEAEEAVVDNIGHLDHEEVGDRVEHNVEEEHTDQTVENPKLGLTKKAPLPKNTKRVSEHRIAKRNSEEFETSSNEDIPLNEMSDSDDFSSSEEDSSLVPIVEPKAVKPKAVKQKVKPPRPKSPDVNKIVIETAKSKHVKPLPSKKKTPLDVVNLSNHDIGDYGDKNLEYLEKSFRNVPSSPMKIAKAKPKSRTFKVNTSTDESETSKRSVHEAVAPVVHNLAVLPEASHSPERKSSIGRASEASILVPANISSEASSEEEGSFHQASEGSIIEASSEDGLMVEETSKVEETRSTNEEHETSPVKKALPSDVSASTDVEIKLQGAFKLEPPNSSPTKENPSNENTKVDDDRYQADAYEIMAINNELADELESSSSEEAANSELAEKLQNSNSVKEGIKPNDLSDILDFAPEAHGTFTSPMKEQAGATFDRILTSPRKEQAGATFDRILTSPRKEQAGATFERILTSPRKESEPIHPFVQKIIELLDLKVCDKELAEVSEKLNNVEEIYNIMEQLSNSEYELNDDIEGGLTGLISVMPEEEENMTVEEWIDKCAENCTALLNELCNKLIQNFKDECNEFLTTLQYLPAK